MEPAPGDRQARLAAWASALLTGRCTLVEAVDAVVGDDAVHDVVDVPGSVRPVPLADFLERLPALGVTGLRYLPAAPGDVSALPGPAAFNARAVAAGGAVVCLGPDDWGLLPTLEAHGTDDDRVWSVRWVVETVGRRVLPAVDLRQARRQLAEAVTESLDQLHRLDVARPRPEADALARRWGSGRPGSLLPPGCPPGAAELLERASHLQEAVALGLTEDGAAVSGWEADRRREALAQLRRTLRHVAADAWNCGLQPEGGGTPVG